MQLGRKHTKQMWLTGRERENEMCLADDTVRRPVKWISYSDTNVGKVRTINEDSVLSIPEEGLWTVADGMGGHEAGEVASGMIISSLRELTYTGDLNDRVTAIENNLTDVNQRLLEYSEIMLDGRVVGSTMTSLMIYGQAGVCMWVGDSRLYRLRNNELTQITCDHSVVMELLKQGSITLDEVENHPDANVITRAIGTSNDICVDMDIFNVMLGDTYLLCSDGLYNAVSHEEILSILKSDNTEQIVDGLIFEALKNGAPDNVSAIVVKGVPDN